MSDWLQLAIIAFILLSIGYVVWRGGQANPENTGDLGKAISGVEARVGSVDLRLSDLERDVQRLDEEAASKADIRRMEKALKDLQSEVSQIGKDAASREATLDHVRTTVDRMLDVIVNKGMR